MNAVVLCIVSAAFGYLLDAILVGAVLSVTRRRSEVRFSNRTAWLALLAVFAVLDLYWIPAAVALDLTVNIGNADAAAVLGHRLPVTEMSAFGWFEILVWGAQGFIAVWIAERFSGSTNAIQPALAADGAARRR